MKAEHFDEVVSRYYNRRPFQPFTVALVNGDRFEVDHPTAITFRDGFAVVIGPGGVLHIFDHEGVAQLIGDLMNAPESVA